MNIKLLRNLIREAILTGDNEITVLKLDLDNVLVKSQLFYHTIKGLNVYCPYTHVGSWRDIHTRDPDMDVLIQAGASPFQVADVVKKDIEFENRNHEVYELTMTMADRMSWWNKMANLIHDKFKDQRVVAVTYADSSSNMPSYIAKRVSDLLNVSLIKAFQKNYDIDKISINMKRFNRWAETPSPMLDDNNKPIKDVKGNILTRPKTREEIKNFFDQLEENLFRLLEIADEGGRISISRDIPVQRREFFNGIHIITPNSLDDVTGNILIIDDNIDSGSTFLDIQHLLEEFGGRINPLFAAGFRINRSDTKKTAARAESRANQKKEQERQKRYKDHKPNDNVIKYSKNQPQEYNQGDTISHKNFGLGIVEKVDPRNKKITVNFEDQIRELVYTPLDNVASQLLPEPLKEEIIYKILYSILHTKIGK